VIPIFTSAWHLRYELVPPDRLVVGGLVHESVKTLVPDIKQVHSELLVCLEYLKSKPCLKLLGCGIGFGSVLADLP
jgi:hypothetical protein